MRTLIIALACLLSACATNPSQTATCRAEAFYKSYLTLITGDGNEYPASELREYVASDTIARIEKIQNIPEQEIIGSDYYTYVQDYDPSWIKALQVEDEKPFLGGVIVQVREGGENGKTLHLETYMRRQDGKWKIYRVRDVTNNFEHPIFDAGAIAWAKSEAESGL